MKKNLLLICFVCLFSFILFPGCSSNQETKTQTAKPDFGGFETEVKWGEHLVTICGCNDCHTPKKFTAHGMELDSSLLLSGHPAAMPVADVNRKEMESKGIVSTTDLTSWVGPWGISFTANLTSDMSGIGNWELENFTTAIRKGKFKGIEAGRSLLPPMPWEMYKHWTDAELKAVFMFLKSTKPIANTVPETQPPVTAMAK